MKSKIIQIVEQYPKRYHQSISKDADLMQWVNDNCVYPSNDIRGRIYSAVHQVDSRCEHGIDRKLNKWKTGFKFCGRASVCQCSKENSSRKSKELFASKTKEEKSASNEKRRKTNLKNHGMECPAHKNKFKMGDRLPDSAKVMLLEGWLYNQHIELKKSVMLIAEEIGVHDSTVREHLHYNGITPRRDTNSSASESQIASFVYHECGVDEVYIGNYDLIHPYELDVISYETKFAVEYNGLRYHSVSNDPVSKKDKRHSHRFKTIKCQELGYKLLHIAEYSWLKKPDNPKTWLKRYHEVLTEIQRCDLVVREVPISVASEFYLENGAYGINLDCDKVVGLYSSDILIEIYPIYLLETEVRVYSPTCKKYTNPVGSFDCVIEAVRKINGAKELKFYECLTIPEPKGVVISSMKPTDIIEEEYYICSNSKFYDHSVITSSPDYDSTKDIVENSLRMNYGVYFGSGHRVWIS